MSVWKPHVTVASLIEQAGRFLLVEEEIDGQRVINQPAGHLEEGETLAAAAIRETREETGYHFQPEFLVGIYRWQQPNAGRTFVRFCFAGRSLGHDASLPLDQGIIRPLWLSRSELLAHSIRSPLVLACIDDHLAGRRYPLDLLQELT